MCAQRPHCRWRCRLWLGPGACEGAAPRQVRGSCSPRSHPLQHLRGTKRRSEPDPWGSPPCPTLGHYFSHFYRLSLECVCREDGRGCLVQVVCDPGPRLLCCHQVPVRRGAGAVRWIPCVDSDVQMRAEAAWVCMAGPHSAGPSVGAKSRGFRAAGRAAGVGGVAGSGSDSPMEASAAQGSWQVPAAPTH